MATCIQFFFFKNEEKMLQREGKGFDCVYFGRNGGEINLMEQKYASSLHIIENPAFLYELCDNKVFSILKRGVVPPESVVSRPR